VVGFFSVLFFFFQAEDGIRDRNVTGVQTCALPILLPRPSCKILGSPPLSSWSANSSAARMCGISPDVHDLCWILATWPTSLSVRSEERRVGKGCRGGWEREESTKRKRK